MPKKTIIVSALVALAVLYAYNRSATLQKFVGPKAA